MSVQCTQALANNNGKTPLRSKHFTWTVVPPPPSLKLPPAPLQAL